jgi:hypothetical protein
MRTNAAVLGICKSATCQQAGNGPIELYDGPGRYCPDCGEMLQDYVPGKSAWSLPESAAVPAHDETPVPVPVPVPVPPAPSAQPSKPRERQVAPALSRWRRPLLVRAIIVVVLVAAVTLGAKAFLPSSASGDVVSVCGSSMTDRVMRDLLAGYSTQKGAQVARFEARTADCAIRFGVRVPSAQQDQRRRDVIAHDGVVAIVNAQNTVTALTPVQLGNILRGNVANWSSIGGSSRPIVAYLPVDATDEARIVAETLMKGAPIGTSVVRLPSSADVVRAVVAANGSGAIGLVAFSAAVPGKVVALAGFPTPSTLSISDERYPLSVELTIASADANHYWAASPLLAYARSEAAKTIAVQDGIAADVAAR